MFTGIVMEVGAIKRVAGARVEIACGAILDDAQIGDSIAINGCCLTIVELGDGWFGVDVTEESFRRTNLGDLRPGSAVNLEPALRANDRLGGHIVQGHVDAVGEIVNPAPELQVRMPTELLRYVIDKGSITVDGVSLTVVKALDDGFTVAVIPHTGEVTTLSGRRVGDRVNLEVDLIAKYVEKMIGDR